MILINVILSCFEWFFKIKTMMIFTRISFKGLGNSYLIISIHISFPKVNTMLSHFRLCQDQTWAPIYASHRYHSHSWYHCHHRNSDDSDDNDEDKKTVEIEKNFLENSWQYKSFLQRDFSGKGAKSISCQSKSVS